MLQQLAARAKAERDARPGMRPRYSDELKADLVAAAKHFGNREVAVACGLGLSTVSNWASNGVEPSDYPGSGSPIYVNIKHQDEYEEAPAEEQQQGDEPTTVIEIVTRKGTIIKVYE